MAGVPNMRRMATRTCVRGADTFSRAVAFVLVAALAVLTPACDSSSPRTTPVGPTPAPPSPPATAAIVATVTVEPDSVLAGLDVTATVALTAAAPAGGAVITLTSSHTAATVPATLTVPAGATSGTVTIATREVPATTRVTVTATSGTSSASAGFDITPVPRQAQGFSIEPDRIRGGETATGRVRLGAFAAAADAPLALADVVVTLTSSHPAAQVPPSVTVPAGQTEATFPIVTTGVPQAISLTLTAAAGGETRTTGMQVLPEPPVLSSLAPATGTVGTTVTVTLTGSGFIADDTTVSVGGAALVGVSNVTVVNGTRATATFAIDAGATAGTYPVTVTTSGGPSGARGFTVTSAATAPTPSGSTLTSINATSGSASGGRGVTLTGTGLTGATGVTFGGVAATSVNVVNSTTVTAVTPAHAAGVVNVVISTPAGGATLSNGYTYVATAVGQAAHGGVIAALNGGLNNLIAATADNSAAIAWGPLGATGATSTTDGATNTTTIVANLGNNGGTPYAAQVCSDFEVDSQGNTPCQAGNTCYSDWFLPAGSDTTASGQLHALFTDRVAIGGFAAAGYWSSSEAPGGTAWGQEFSNGIRATVNKAVNRRVRCVRAFTP